MGERRRGTESSKGGKGRREKRLQVQIRSIKRTHTRGWGDFARVSRARGGSKPIWVWRGDRSRQRNATHLCHHHALYQIHMFSVDLVKLFLQCLYPRSQVPVNKSKSVHFPSVRVGCFDLLVKLRSVRVQHVWRDLDLECVANKLVRAVLG